MESRAYLFGFVWWKVFFIKKFLQEYDRKQIYIIIPFFLSSFKIARNKGLDPSSNIYIWGRKSFPEVEAFAKKHGIDIYRVEDGFIRSIGLGSDLTQPYSQVFDKKGIYFDPTQPSDLEEILNNYDFESETTLIERAKRLKEQIILNKISKYNADVNEELDLLHAGKTVVLVVGQVEDDASIQYGAAGMTNLELLKEVRKNCPEKYIVFKPHPDVLSGNRGGDIPKDDALMYCDEVITDVGMASVLKVVDEVHTMTSLTGFEALVYGKKVYTYGMPFYAGWGLTTDTRKCKRRKRNVSTDALIAATYILYPRYISPKTKQYCEVEDVIRELSDQKAVLDRSRLLRLKFKGYSYLSRFSQKLVSFLK